LKARWSQLDGIRGFSASLVVLIHMELIQWSEQSSLITIFFVLSSFLITNILLAQRQAFESGKSTAAQELRRFYIRRAIRILPVAYVVTGASCLLSSDVWRASPWHFGYLTNVYFSLYGIVDLNWIMLHFWSLAVEEQFYLIWPWFVLFLPRTALIKLFATFVVIALVARWAFSFWSPQAVLYMLPSHLDAFALGGLMGVGREDPKAAEWSRSVARVGLWVGVPLYFLFLWMAQVSPQTLTPVRSVLEPLALAAATLWLVDRALRDACDPLGWLLQLRPLSWWGLRSYSLYAWHPLVLLLVPMLLGVEQLNSWPQYGVVVVAVFVVTLLSFQLLERSGEVLRAKWEARISGKRLQSAATGQTP